MFETRMRRVARGALPLLMMVLGGAVGPAAGPLAAQTPGEEPATAEGEEAIEWNFRPASATGAEADVSLQERWAAPFAVISQGRPAPRTPREVVVLRDSVAARRVAVAQAATGQSVAEVTVDEEGAESAPAAEEAAEPEGGESEDDTAEEVGEDGPPSAEPAPEGEREAPPSSASARTHRVAYGETWFGLAREYRISSRDLAAANPDVDPERLQAGTVLRIPAAGSADAAPRRHTVTRGDTLFGIARRYGVSPAAIRSANRLPDDVVRLGQTLVIPREEASR